MISGTVSKVSYDIIQIEVISNYGLFVLEIASLAPPEEHSSSMSVVVTRIIGYYS